jgi:hypothetical protein
MTILKLDRSSWILITLALSGIALSLFSLYKVSLSSEHSGQELVGKIHHFAKDTRLKRHGDISWYQINEKLDCFSNDLIFTGHESYLTLELLDGSRISLHPNSLISLLPGQVSLNSGTIEIKAGKKSLIIESFGDKFEVEQEASFKLVSTDQEKKIIPLNNKSKKLAQVENLKYFFDLQKLSIMNPSTGAQFPRFDGQNLTFEWQSKIKNRKFNISFSASPEFTDLIYIEETQTNSIQRPLISFPAGLIHWRVQDLHEKVVVSSSFFITEIPPINLMHPEPGSKTPLFLVKRDGLLLKWNNPSGLLQKLELSKSADFKDLLHSIETTDSEKIVSLGEEGNYFWRVSYMVGSEIVQGTQVASFILEPEIKIVPLTFLSFPKKMDFTFTKQYVLKVHDLNKSEEYHFSLLKDGKLISRQTKKVPSLVLNELLNGKYTIQVEGKINSELQTPPLNESFEVENTPPIKAPKIKNKMKVDLFVYWLNEINDLQKSIKKDELRLVS